MWLTVLSLPVFCRWAPVCWKEQHYWEADSCQITIILCLKVILDNAAECVTPVRLKPGWTNYLPQLLFGVTPEMQVADWFAKYGLNTFDLGIPVDINRTLPEVWNCDQPVYTKHHGTTQLCKNEFQHKAGDWSIFVIGIMMVIIRILHLIAFV